jgi:hypothetical protein
MGVAAREAESYESLRATIERMKEEQKMLIGIHVTDGRVIQRLQSVVRDLQHEIGQYRAALDDALTELSLVR